MNKGRKIFRESKKAKKVLEVLSKHPYMSNSKVAKRAGCSAGYVWLLKRDPSFMQTQLPLPLPEKPKVTKPTQQQISDLAYKMTQGRQASNPIDVNEVLAERGKEYGSFSAQAQITQTLRNAAHRFAADHGKVFNSDQALALDMIFVKLGRILSGNPNYVDNWVDIAGYAKLVAQRLGSKVR